MKRNKNKYFAKAIKADGEVFDSKKEYLRYKELELLERAGEITELRRQVRYLLIPSQFDMVTDEHGRRKRICVERECNYIADFVYRDKRGNLVVEDCKGAIELLSENGAYNLMREGHSRERQLAVGSSIDLIRESIRTSDNQNQTADAAIQTLLQPLCKVYRAELFALLIEQHHVVAIANLAQYGFAFGSALLLDRQILGVLDIRQGSD